MNDPWTAPILKYEGTSRYLFLDGEEVRLDPEMGVAGLRRAADAGDP
jgi:hypothetical protein